MFVVDIDVTVATHTVSESTGVDLETDETFLQVEETSESLTTRLSSRLKTIFKLFVPRSKKDQWFSTSPGP